MIFFFNFRGYTERDPLDKSNGAGKFIIALCVNLILTVCLLWVITSNHIVHFNGFELFGMSFSPLGTMILEGIVNCLIFAPLIVALRKSSSVVPFLIVFLPYFLLDLYIESHYRCPGCDISKALWTYFDPSPIPPIQPPALKFAVTMCVDALVFGILGLFLSRIVAAIVYKNRLYLDPSKEQKEKLFPDAWTREELVKPSRDPEYWVLRLLAFGYFAYFLLLMLGFLGITPWPLTVQGLLETSFSNPAMLINTFSKILIMVVCGWIGAYNKNVRWYSTLVMLIGHLVSTIASLIFYFYADSPKADHDFLLTSAIIDGIMVLIFIWILARNTESRKYHELKIPNNFSVPQRLTTYFYYSISIIMLMCISLLLYFRIFGNTCYGLGAVFGSPDPTICNSITMYTAMGLLAYLLARYESLRDSLTAPLLLACLFPIIVTIPWMVIGDIAIKARYGSYWVDVPVYFLALTLFNVTLFSSIVMFRKMVYNVDYVITAMNPSSARNVESLDAAFFDSDIQDQSAVAQMVDRYIAGIRGRKRGLLNFPFWLIEHIFPTLYGLHPTFSAMSTEEQKYFLRKYMLRIPREREMAFVPEIAALAAQLGLACYSIVANAHYSMTNNRHAIGYLPPEAREALQGDIRTQNPPTIGAAPLPTDHTDPKNFKQLPPSGSRLVAPRVVTPIDEPRIPDEVDFMILGSGAGGATCAYRLASESNCDPSRMLIIERGNRYSPLQDMTTNELEMLQKLYKEGGLQLTKRFDMMVLQGEAVGGSTVINNAVCLRMPQAMRTHWQNVYGIDLANLQAEYNQTAAELDIHLLNLDHGINDRVRTLFSNAIAGYNSIHPNMPLVDEFGNAGIEELQVNYLNDLGDGFWNMGNKYMRKRSMLETYIPWAESRGVRTVSSTTAVQILITDGKADRVILRTNSGDLKVVKVNKAVILSGGVISSSHLLMRSGIKKNVGKRVACNFAFPVAYIFDKEYLKKTVASEFIDAWDGQQISLGARRPVINPLATRPENSVMFESYINPPASFALSLPFQFDKRQYIMDSYRRLVNFGALVGSEPMGEIQQKADLWTGRPIEWKLGDGDQDNVKYTLTALAELGKNAGAEKIILPMRPGVELSLNDIPAFIGALQNYPLRIDDVYFATAHPQGGNMMAGEVHRDTRVVDEEFRVVGTKNVYVADASIFPTGITVNPQWTILAMSSMAAKSVMKYHS